MTNLGGTIIRGESKNQKPFTKPVKGVPFSASRAVVSYAMTLVGVKEQPPGTNDGAAVHRIQASTGAYREPWCVSTIQDICLHVSGHTIANRTAGAYYLRTFAQESKWTVEHPQPGCFVVYQLGQGHAGTVVRTWPDGTFDAVEGNHSDRCELVHRDPRTVGCTFLVPSFLR